MAGGNSTDEEGAPLTAKQEKVHDEDSDTELEKNGGIYAKKFAFLQVTFRLPIQGPVQVIALIYGFLPFIVPAVFLIHFLIHRHRLGIYGFCVCIVASILNELIFKPIVKDPRPVESANKFRDKDGKMKMKPGMPSGHVLNATTTMVWATLEVAFRGPGFNRHFYTTLEWLAFIFILMGPVPWARWKNKDHTLNQCLVAGGIGIVFGILAFVIRTQFLPVYWKPWPAPIELPTNSTGNGTDTGNGSLPVIA